MINERPSRDFAQQIDRRLSRFRRRQAARACAPDARRLARIDAIFRRMDDGEAARALAWLADKYLLQARYGPSEEEEV